MKRDPGCMLRTSATNRTDVCAFAKEDPFVLRSEGTSDGCPGAMETRSSNKEQTLRGVRLIKIFRKL